MMYNVEDMVETEDDWTSTVLKHWTCSSSKGFNNRTVFIFGFFFSCLKRNLYFNRLVILCSRL